MISLEFAFELFFTLCILQTHSVLPLTFVGGTINDLIILTSSRGFFERFYDISE